MLQRRSVLSGIVAAAVAPVIARAQSYIDIRWNDLLPEGEPVLRNAFRDVIDHNGAPLSSLQPKAGGFRTELSGEIVRLPGFIVPIDYEATGVTTFILVPYAGASCIHVPPPPANQLVLVTTDVPYESQGLFEAVNVIGRLDVASTTTELAEVGYAISADNIKPYGS